MNANIIGNKVFVNGSPLPPIPGAKSSVSLSQVGNRLYVNGYEYRNGRWKRTLRAIMFPIQSLPFVKPVKLLQTYQLFTMMNKGQKKSWALHNQLNGIRMVLLRWTDNCYLEGQMKLSS